ncbi:hypothetical protein MUG94_03195 [Arthrobacter gengyunqii]|uniref:Membrane-associated oxidoreductase n=1 Tax=Arthrobacter gengyunqii TaxID=2886940 RepID=A0A9X1M540_9MICC|nr:hypothetical protein [Arthrobacter gengyunqii]MCC3271097.1 hypothetical protein [Arthrobacter gengyunqii]UOY96795.1 hypothetical protein MUG94_03195 [Arthrobacter gengyunqii]
MINDAKIENIRTDTHVEEWRKRLIQGIESGERVQPVDQVGSTPTGEDKYPVSTDSLPTLDAAVLRDILVNFVGKHDPRGLTITNVRIVGELDLEHLVLDFPIAFEHVHMDSDLNLNGFNSPQLDFYKSGFQSIRLEHASFNKNLIIQECSIEEQLDIGKVSCGELCLDSTTIFARTASEWPALKAQGLTVCGPVNAYNIECRGEVSFVGAKVGGHLALSGAKVTKKCGTSERHLTTQEDMPYKHCTDNAICMDSVEVGGVLELRDLDCGCSVRLRGAKIGGQLILTNSKIGRRNPVTSKGRSVSSCQLDLTGAYIGHNSILQGLITGNVTLHDATMKDLDLDNAQVGSSEGKSIEATGASLASVSLTGGRLQGVADFQQSTIAGSITSRPSNPRTVLAGLNISRAVIEGGVDLGYIQITKYGVSAEHANITGQFVIHLNSSVATAVPASPAIDAANSRMQNFRTTGSTALGGSMNFDGATVAHLQLGGTSSRENEYASNKSGSVIAKHEMTSMRARNANILHLQVHNDSAWQGGLILSGSAIGHLNFESGSSSAPSVTGTTAFTLTNVSGLPFTDWKASLSWLQASTEASSLPYEIDAHESGPLTPTDSHPRSFRAQPWLEVARVFESSGQESDGRRLRYEAADRLLRTRKSWFSNTVWRHISKWTIGHGFYSQAAIAWLGILWVISTLLVGMNAAAFTPTDRSAAFIITSEDASAAAIRPTVEEPAASDSTPTAESKVATAVTTPAPLAYPSLIPPLYAVDVVLSPLGTGQSTAWQVSTDAWLSVGLTIIKMMSWALLGLFITGISGLLGKK